MARPPVIVEQVKTAGLDLLSKAPEGLRFSELRDLLQKRLPEVEPSTLATMIGERIGKDPNVYRPERGLYRLAKFKESEPIPVEAPEEFKAVPIRDLVRKRIPAAVRIGAGEAAFYEPFKVWLETDVQECTRATVVGGNRFGSKWGTPDVVGVWKAAPDDIIKPPEEIVSAEIKTDTNGLITAFGQACAYKLFSHKTYIAIPRESGRADIERLEALCQITGIGLVLFDLDSPSNPRFEIRTRPVRHDPDIFYMNEAAKNIKELF